MRGKIAASSIIGLLVLAVAGSPALSGPPDGLETYDAGADSAAFSLMLTDQQIAGGLTMSEVHSDGPVAVADGAALLILGETPGGTAPSAAPDGEASNEACAVEIPLPDPIDLAEVNIGCVQTAAALVDGAPMSSSTSQATVIPIGGAGLTQEVLGALFEPLIQPILDGLGALDPVVNLDSVLGALLEQLADSAGNVAQITVAPNGSETAASDTEGVLARAFADGATIELLPLAEGTLLTITVGSSEAMVVRDAVTGEATPVANPALIDIEWGNVQLNLEPICLLDGALCLNDLTAQLEEAINGLIATLAESSPLACGEDGPLADLVCLEGATGHILDAAQAAAEGYDYGEGTVGARTSALRLELLAIANDGVPLVSLALSDAVAAANATPAQEPPATTAAPPTTELSMPRTGSSNTPILALGVALAGAMLVVRMRRLALKR